MLKPEFPHVGLVGAAHSSLPKDPAEVSGEADVCKIMLDVLDTIFQYPYYSPNQEPG